MNGNYLTKAERRLETAKWALEKGYICSAVSNCYYALFNLMQSVVDEPEKGKWTHGGLPKEFSRVVCVNRLLPREEIKGVVRLANRLYALRKRADYTDELLESSEEAMGVLQLYISKVEGLLRVLKEIGNESNQHGAD